jgi:hypothetical protein
MVRCGCSALDSSANDGTSFGRIMVGQAAYGARCWMSICVSRQPSSDRSRPGPDCVGDTGVDDRKDFPIKFSSRNSARTTHGRATFADPTRPSECGYETFAERGGPTSEAASASPCDRQDVPEPLLNQAMESGSSATPIRGRQPPSVRRLRAVLYGTDDRLNALACADGFSGGDVDSVRNAITSLSMSSRCEYTSTALRRPRCW